MRASWWPAPVQRATTRSLHTEKHNEVAPPSFDHLVRAGEQRWGNCQSKRLGSVKIDDWFVLGRRLHRKIGRLLTLEDAIDVARRAAVWIDQVRAIGYQ